MTQHEFRDRLKRLGMKRTTFAHLTGVTVAWLYRLGTEERPFPAWIPLLIAAWEQNKELREQQRG